MSRVLACAVAVLASVPGARALADTSADENAAFLAMGESAVTDLYRPAHEGFAIAALELERDVRDLCDSPGAGALGAARAAYAGAVSRFSSIELLRVGPLVDDNRLNRLFYWPDTRRAGERQLRALLAGDAAEITADSMPARSVAVQGLPALERLLHGDAARALAAPADGPDTAGAARCAVAAAVAGNVAALATVLDEGWRAENGIARQMREPRADDALFRTPEEIIRALLTQLETGLGIVIDRKLAPLLDAERPSRRGAPFGRSAATPANLAGNVEALRALAIDTGMAARVGLERELAFEFRVAAAHVERLGELQPPPPLPDAPGADESGVLRALDSALSSIRDTVNERLSPTLGVRTGFNAEDGD